LSRQDKLSFVLIVTGTGLIKNRFQWHYKKRFSILNRFSG